jgi:hypothetical protein
LRLLLNHVDAPAELRFQLFFHVQEPVNVQGCPRLEADEEIEIAVGAEIVAEG